MKFVFNGVCIRRKFGNKILYEGLSLSGCSAWRPTTLTTSLHFDYSCCDFVGPGAPPGD